MKKAISLFFWMFVFGLLIQVVAHAGVVSEELQASLKSMRPHEEISVIVRFADRVDLEQFKELHRSIRRARIIRALKKKTELSQLPFRAFLQGAGVKRMTPLWIINGMAITARADVIRFLAKSPLVESVSLDSSIPPPEMVEGSGALPEWNIEAIHAPEVWNLGFQGDGVVVASMDTGVDVSHPDLNGRWRGGTNSWYDPNGEHDSPVDKAGASTGHGTAVMGLILGGSAGGSAIGVAPDAQWIAVKIFSDSGPATEAGIHQGFQWLLDPDGDPDTDDAPDIVNNSWAIDSPGLCIEKSYHDDVRVLKSAGIAMIFAAGNVLGGAYPSSSKSPANWPESFAVGSVDNYSVVANTSARGPSECDDTIFPEVVAPGVAVRSSVPASVDSSLYRDVSGTSFATPHVSGAMALLKSAFPAASVAELENALAATAQDLGDAGPDNDYGHGLINVLAAYPRFLDKLITIKKRLDDAFKLKIYNLPPTVGGNTGPPIASDNWLRKNVVAIAALNYDADPQDELAVVTSRADEGFKLFIYDLPATVGGNTGPPIASDNWLGKNVVAIAALNYDGDPQDELAVVTHNADDCFQLLIYDPPATVGGNTGPPIASDDCLGQNIIDIAAVNYDADPQDELAVVTHNADGCFQLLIYDPPATVGGNTGPPIASDDCLEEENITAISLAYY
ncbi:MAG: S8 family serine peptidase [Deltaproteobacteria bacterium]|nr:S8 family serine peptidase [Deltaproteobacteria bacterium]